MSGDQALILLIIAATMAMFMLGRWRHDMVAVGALLLCVAAGLVPAAEAFSGFGHPAVITVGCIFIISSGLQTTGAVDFLAHKILPKSAGPSLSIAALAGFGAALSAFMNNVGAMALLIPVAVKIASKQKLPPGKILMPLAFGTILGGTITLIGTPPNLIVSGFRAETGAGGFRLFDFAPLGAPISLLGIIFLAFLGWRIVPARKEAGVGAFDTGKYLTEVRVAKESKISGKTFAGAEKLIEESDAQMLAMIRNNIRVQTPSPRQLLREDDILIIEAEPESLSSLLTNLGLKLEEEVQVGETEKEDGGNPDKKAAPKKAGDGKNSPENESEPAGRDEITLAEFVVMPYSKMVGRSASDINLRTLYGINLLAFSRRGKRSIKRLSSTVIRAGDVLLMQGLSEPLFEFAEDFRLAPLAERSLSIPKKNMAIKASAIFAVLIAASTLWGAPIAVAFSAGALAFLAFRIVPLRSVYDKIDWPVIILLGAMLPVAGAVGTSGAADIIADFLIEKVAKQNPAAVLAVILGVTMLATDFMNNAATAAVMCPIAISAAGRLGANPDAFLMAVAVGASCAFLTPIGHQNNTLILGPGGFRFGDYWRLGVLVELIVLAAGIPLLLLIWPL